MKLRDLFIDVCIGVLIAVVALILANGGDDAVFRILDAVLPR